MRQIIAAVAMLAVNLPVIAIDSSTASFNAQTATTLAKQGKFEDAYREIAWLLRDKELSIRSYAENVLRNFPEIANAKVASFSDDEILLTICDDELSIDDVINQLEPFADKALLNATKARVQAIVLTTDKEAALTQCREIRKDRLAKEKRQHEESIASITREMPSILRKLDTDDFCVEYGRTLRKEPNPNYAPAQNLLKIFTQEASRRGLSIDKNLTSKERIRMGINRCTLYAAWGYPERINRTVGSWGVHAQLIYGDYGPYVYLNNGIVRSWQD